MNPITVAVSSCLMGHKVRFDGADKRSAIVELEICGRFRCVPLCPEYAIGLGVPRAPIQLVRDGDDIRVLGVSNNAMDVTLSLQKYADFISSTLPQICGYVFKARSPSCGLQDTPVFDLHGIEIDKRGGAYASQIVDLVQNLPVIDEIQLEDMQLRTKFIKKVEDYAQFSRE